MSLSNRQKRMSLYIQDSKLEGWIPSLGRKLYLVWNQVVARNGKEISLDRCDWELIGSRLGADWIPFRTLWGCVKKTNSWAFAPLEVQFGAKDYLVG
jgi:hypothetical protein